MSAISASQVKELREKTGLGLMDCKKALEEANGDIDLAIEELRKTSGIKASKKSGRSAADGLIGITNKDKDFFMIEVNCETDFVARDDSYINFAKEMIKNSRVQLFLVDDRFQLAKFIKANIYGKKIVIGMGAGTISSWMRELPKLL